MSTAPTQVDRAIRDALLSRQMEAADRAEKAAADIDRAVGRLEARLASAIKGGAGVGRLAQIIRTVYPAIRTAMLAHLRDIGGWGYDSLVDALMDNLPPQHVHALYRVRAGVVEATGPELQLARQLFPPPTRSEVDRIVRRRSDAEDGLTWEQRLELWSRKITDKDKLAGDIAIGLAAGENIDQIEKRVRPVVQNIKSSSMRIARTESMRVVNDMAEQAYEDAGDVVRGFQMVATLDGATRPHHAARHGLVWGKDEGVSKTSKLRMKSDTLPDEPNCRCFLSPVLATDQDLDQLRNTGPVQERFAPTDGTPEQHRAFQRWFDEQRPGRRIAVVGQALWTAVGLATGREPTWIDFVQFGTLPSGRGDRRGVVRVPRAPVRTARPPVRTANPPRR